MQEHSPRPLSLTSLKHLPSCLLTEYKDCGYSLHKVLMENSSCLCLYHITTTPCRVSVSLLHLKVQLSSSLDIQHEPTNLHDPPSPEHTDQCCARMHIRIKKSPHFSKFQTHAEVLNQNQL